MTHVLMYRSAARHPFPHYSDLEILRTAWAHNAQTGITGYLVRTQWEFFQVLEGPREAVQEVYRHICADERHSNAQIIGEWEADGRRFGSWAMGYAEDIDKDPAARVFLDDAADPGILISAMEDLAARRGGVSGRAAAL